MSELRVPTVEVFRDIDSVDIDVAPALTGIEMVSEIAGKFQLVNTERKLRLGYDRGTVDERKIRWPNFTADLNLVLTNRQFTTIAESGGRVEGRASVREQKPGMALVSTTAQFVEEIVAHELGHLFGLKNLLSDPMGSSGQIHCPKPFCIMAANRQVIDYKVPRPTTLRRQWLERLGLAQQQYDIQSESMATGFCGSCADDLRKGAVIKFLVKNGLNQPRGIY